MNWVPPVTRGHSFLRQPAPRPRIGRFRAGHVRRLRYRRRRAHRPLRGGSFADRGRRTRVQHAKGGAEVIEHFKHCAWLHRNGTIEDVSGAPIPRECAVYAFRQFEQWIYIGSASRGARSRLRSYRRNQVGNVTKLKHAELRDYLQRGPLEFWVMPIAERLRIIDGMPIDWLLGVESGLIKTLHPVVNRRERIRSHVS